MEFKHAWAITLRHLRLILNDTNIQIALFFWPFMDVVVWGGLGLWMQQSEQPHLQVSLLSSILLWQLVHRTSIMLAYALVEELLAGNIITLFATPLQPKEWMLGAMMLSAIATSCVMLYSLIFIKLLYSVSLLFLLWLCLLFGPPLFIAGISLGFFILQVILYRGKRAVELIFLIVWITAPLSAVYFPREVLPEWAQTLGAVLPMSYAFSGLRNYVLHGENPLWNIVITYALSIFYCAVAMALFRYSFLKTKKWGLARLMD